MAFYVGTAPRFPPEITPLLTSIDSPTLVVEVAASSLSDDIGRKQLLYERLGVKEYWVIDVNAGQVIALH